MCDKSAATGSGELLRPASFQGRFLNVSFASCHEGAESDIGSMVSPVQPPRKEVIQIFIVSSFKDNFQSVSHVFE